MIQTPSISFLISSVDAWPHARDTLNSILNQMDVHSCEVILVSSTSEVYPKAEPIMQPAAKIPRIAIFPDQDIFSLRLSGLSQCKGSWIVLLEDHNIAPQGWVNLLLNTINSGTPSLVLVSALINGSETSRLDQANFLFNFGAYLPEVAMMPFERMPVIAGVCFNRQVVKDINLLKSGELESVLLPDLFRKGHTTFIPQLAIAHIQSNPLVPTILKHYYNAKACSGILKALNGNRIDWKTFLLHLHAPIYFFRKWTISPYKKILNLGYRGTWIYLMAFGVIYGIGSIIGWLFGTGKSAKLLE